MQLIKQFNQISNMFDLNVNELLKIEG